MPTCRLPAGQSFASPAPRYGDAAETSAHWPEGGANAPSIPCLSGKVDDYTEQGHFRTSAMAEGAIEGEASMYELLSPHDTSFAFSRFDTPTAPSPPEAPPGAGGAEAASLD